MRASDGHAGKREMNDEPRGGESEAWRVRMREMRQRMQEVREHALRDAAAPPKEPDEPGGFISARQKSRRRRE